MTNRLTTGAHVGALVHEKGGGPTMFVAAEDTQPGHLVCKWKESVYGEDLVATFPAEELVVVVSARGGDR